MTPPACAFSADGRYFAALSNGPRVWDVASGVPRPRFLHRNPDRDPWALAISADGEKLALAGKKTRAVETATGKVIADFDLGYKGFPAAVAAIGFSRDDKTLAIAVQDGGFNRRRSSVVLSDAATGKFRRRLDMDDVWCACLGFSPDGKILGGGSSLTGGDQDRICLWEVATGKEILRLDGLSGVECIAFSPDGKTLASAGWDKVIRLWDVKTGKEIQQLKGHQGKVLALSFSPDGRRLVSGSGDTTALIWRLARPDDR
jgi:hypothetical protein